MSEPTQSEVAWANVVETGPNIPPDLASAAVPADPSMAPVDVAEVPEPSPDDAPDEVPAGEAEPGSDESPEAVPDEDEDEAPTPPTSRERRIQRFSDLTRERDLAREREKFAAEQAEFWRQQALAGQAKPAEPQAPQVGDGLQRDGTGRPLRPVEEQYATTQEYAQAYMAYENGLLEWNSAQTEQRVLQRLADQKAEQEIREQHPDYEERLQGSQVRLNDHVSAAVMASPYKHALFYYFATHPEEERRFATLSGPQAFLAIGELQAALRAAAPPPPTNGSPPAEPPAPTPMLPTTSQAPPPIRPARGTAARPTVTDDELPLTDFFTKRNKEERAVQWR